MSIFAVEKLETVRENGMIRFFKLLKDGKCMFDDFQNEISSNDRNYKDLLNIFSVMDYMAETTAILPKTKFNSIKYGSTIIGYEFKKNDLRVYCMKPEENTVVVFGGYKKNQKEDIKKLKRIGDEVGDKLEKIIKEKMDYYDNK